MLLLNHSTRRGAKQSASNAFFYSKCMHFVPVHWKRFSCFWLWDAIYWLVIFKHLGCIGLFSSIFLSFICCVWMASVLWDDPIQMRKLQDFNKFFPRKIGFRLFSSSKNRLFFFSSLSTFYSIDSLHRSCWASIWEFICSISMFRREGEKKLIIVITCFQSSHWENRKWKRKVKTRGKWKK